jgi:Spx/MgsR family transcriptional regulator
MKVYEYKQCSTCAKALKWLDAKGVAYTRVPIVDQPPTKTELKTMLAAIEKRGGSFKNLFNTSGQQYRELGVSEKIKAGMTAAEAIDLLAKNGKLIKRPFVLDGTNGLVGFKEDEWKKAFGQK